MVSDAAVPFLSPAAIHAGLFRIVPAVWIDIAFLQLYGVSQRVYVGFSRVPERLYEFVIEHEHASSVGRHLFGGIPAAWIRLSFMQQHGLPFRLHVGTGRMSERMQYADGLFRAVSAARRELSLMQ